MMHKVKAFFKAESVLCIAALCAIATMFLVPPDSEYLAYIDLRTLALLIQRARLTPEETAEVIAELAK